MGTYPQKNGPSRSGSHRRHESTVHALGTGKPLLISHDYAGSPEGGGSPHPEPRPEGTRAERFAQPGIGLSIPTGSMDVESDQADKLNLVAYVQPHSRSTKP